MIYYQSTFIFDKHLSNKIAYCLKNLFNYVLMLTALSILIIFDAAAQKIETSSMALSGIEFKVLGSGFPDSLSQLNIAINNEHFSESHILKMQNGSFDTSLVISESGEYLVNSIEDESIKTAPYNKT